MAATGGGAATGGDGSRWGWSGGGEPLDGRERQALCDRLDELGPDAPTWCEGWTTGDLAAHLVLRERLRRWGDGARAEVLAAGFPAVVAQLRAGPPALPWGIPVLRTFLNGFEYFVHLEDVRRANGDSPRPATPDLERVCWQVSFLLGLRAARAMRPFALELVAPGRHQRLGRGEAAVLTGPATELALYLAGRRQAVVERGGSAGALAALDAAGTGL